MQIYFQKHIVLEVAESRLTTRQAAEQLGVTKARVVAMIAAGRLQAEKVGVQFLISPKDLAKVRNRKPGRPRKAGK